MRKILNVAEKPDAAKKIAKILSRGNYTVKKGFSKFNAVYEFDYNFQGQNVKMVVTSVTGHLMNSDFEPKYKHWSSCDPKVLFEAKVIKYVPEDKVGIKKTLQRESVESKELILWLDCDREGENISFEVITVCRDVNPRLAIKRARFSEFTDRAILHAINNLVSPNKRDSDAVEARIEIDLRIGAAFTRFQTIRLKNRFNLGLPDQQPISYGPCQFPTLGFVVDRWMKHKNFVPEKFWYIHVSYSKDGTHANFKWKRNRLFDRLCCLVLYQMCVENPKAKVIKINKKEKKKFKPFPLNTVALQKLAARQLRFKAEKTMQVAESLYNKGFISYPRTETTKYNMRDEELKEIIREQSNDSKWGEYANSLLEDNKYRRPRAGNSDDKAHPPIHPTKYPDTSLTDDESKIYELIVRHFLATCSDDAIGHQTQVTIDIQGEIFNSWGLMITAKNYLEIFIYEKWSESTIPVFTLNEIFEPTELMMKEGQTTPPPLLKEADLITLMDKNGIGTDATIAQHIKTIRERGYAFVNRNQYYEPTQLGLALVHGYESMKLDLSKPHLRASMEADMKKISEGKESKEVVLTTNIQMYKKVYEQVVQMSEKLDEAMRKYFTEIGESGQSKIESRQFSQCGICKDKMDLKSQGEKRFLHCSTCRKSHQLPKFGNFSAHEHICPICGYQVLNVETERGTKYTLCPKCFSDPPKEMMSDIENFSLGFRCFNCTKEDCPLAKRGKGIRKCTDCGTNELTLRQKKDKTGYFVGCNGYPKCTKAFGIPGSHGNVKVSSQICGNCTPRPVYKIHFKFSPGEMPPNVPLDLHTCIFCDNLLKEFVHPFASKSQTLSPSTKKRKISQTRDKRQMQIDSLLKRKTARKSNEAASNQSIKSKYFSNTRRVNLSSNNEVLCSGCQQPAKLLTVKKEGINQGRQFYKCPKQGSEQCDFFLWADDVTK